MRALKPAVFPKQALGLEELRPWSPCLNQAVVSSAHASRLSLPVLCDATRTFHQHLQPGVSALARVYFPFLIYPKPCRSLFFFIPCLPILRIILFLQNFKHNKNPVLFQGSTELTHQNSQKNPVHSQGNPQPYSTNTDLMLLSQRELNSQTPLLHPLPPHSQGRLQILLQR